jgi:hypothetical protein
MSEALKPQIGNLQTRYNLHTAPEVQFVVNAARFRGETIANNPEATVGRYLLNLSDRHPLFVQNGSERAAHRAAHINYLVTRETELPQGYLDLQQRIVREAGGGELVLGQQARQEHMNQLRNNQVGRLKRWVEHLGDGSTQYDTWFKYFTLRSVTQLGAYDADKRTFRKRTAQTVGTFPELNVDALRYVHDAIKENPNLSFAKAYGAALERADSVVSPETLAIREGKWVVYEMTNEPAQAERLTNSLEGFNTGWCTAGDATAADQLAEGDFHVYYTKDRAGSYVVPRLAIRMAYDEAVVEVRGIVHGRNDEFGQGVEDSMLETVAERLKQLPGGDSYQDKVVAMRRLTELDHRLKADPESELSIEDLCFLYEVDAPLMGFAYEVDPRGAELRAARVSRKADIEAMFPDITFDLKGALYLVEAGNVRFLAHNLDIFKDLTDDIANPIIASSVPYKEAEDYWFEKGEKPISVGLIENLASFADGSLSHATWQHVSEYTHPDFSHVSPAILYMQENLRKFNQEVGSEENIRRANSMNTWELADTLGTFFGLDANTAGRLLDRGEDDAIKQNLDSFLPTVQDRLKDHFEGRKPFFEQPEIDEDDDHNYDIGLDEDY